MEKFFIGFALVFLFSSTIHTISAQTTDSVVTEQPDTSLIINAVNEFDTLLLDDNLVIDEEANEIFSEKMDSMVNTWFIENMFRSDSTEITYFENYPKNIPDSVYIQRLKDSEEVIAFSYNPVVKNYIKMYTENRRDQVEIMLGLSAYYFPIFEETLDKYNLPLELKFLPIIESALNPKALSRAGANGLWQFMYGTGKSMKLEITSFVDERRDPVKSSDAAARYLKKLYETYGDWHLAIAAYNCGPGNVNRAIRRSGENANYWEIYYRLPRETRGYVPAFIAAAYAMNYYKEHHLLPRLPEISLYTDTIVVNDYLHFDQIATTLNLDKEEIRSLNPMYRRDIVPAKTDKPYPVVLPQEKIMEFIEKDTLVFAFERDKYFPDNTLINPTESSASYFTPVDIEGMAKIIYVVKSGDNVGYISSWFSVRASDLRYWNNINRNLIKVGQKLVIYVDENQQEKFDKVDGMSFAQKQEMIGKSATTAKKAESQPLDPNFDYYTVRNGDSIWEIAQKYAGITSDQIMQLNNIENERGLYVGQKLKIKRKT